VPAEKFSTCTQDGHDVVYAQAWPDALSFLGGRDQLLPRLRRLLGSRPAFLKASLFQ
jgi:hypothetical protein